MESLKSASPPRDNPSEASSFSASPESLSNVASKGSTPPTIIADDASLSSDTLKTDAIAPIGSTELISAPMVQGEQAQLADSTVIPTTETTTNTITVTITSSTTTASVEAEITCAKTENGPEAAPAESVEHEPSTTTTRRSRRDRPGAPVYNLVKLTAAASNHRSKGDGSDGTKGASVRSTPLSTADNDPTAETSKNSIETASDPKPTSRATKSKANKKREESPPRRTATRASGVEAETLTHKLSSLGKRGRKTFEKGVTRMSRELKNLQDTNEYSGIETKPVVNSYWSNGKLVDPSASSEPPAKKAKTQDDSAYDVPVPEEEVIAEQPRPKKRRVKKWLDRGLYAGQEAPANIFKGLTGAEKKKLAQLPELAPSGTANKTFPAPMFSGLRTLIEGRDFKLPFDVCNPLPPGQPKPDEWKKITKNRFVGDAAAYWKKTPHFKDYQSKCVCTAEDGCGETCQNRIMLYECDATNCNIGDENLCQNRAFARLQERTKAGGKFRTGVEVIKTADRGYGIRANRCFQANQIIMEYTGEIITEEECDRRMNEKYKDNECYYLMSFDQNMIIDATTGSIARFVNHSCQPNCRMVKWIVSGQPRMALFAGDEDIMTGEELTYDYNFDPFSAKNVQKCLCGSANCRGVLGPKPKEVKPPKPSKEELAKAAKEAKEAAKGSKGAKRKRKDSDEPTNAEGTAAKKQKTKAAAGVKAPKTAAKGKTAPKAATKGPAAVAKGDASKTIPKAKESSGKKDKTLAAKASKVTKSKPVKKSYGKAKATANKITDTAQQTLKKTAPCKINLVAAGAKKAKADETTETKAKSPVEADGESDKEPKSLNKGHNVTRIKLVNYEF